MKKELLEKIIDHLLTDIKPSTYMKSIEDDLWGTPLQINIIQKEMYIIM